MTEMSWTMDPFAGAKTTKTTIAAFHRPRKLAKRWRRTSITRWRICGEKWPPAASGQWWKMLAAAQQSSRGRRSISPRRSAKLITTQTPKMINSWQPWSGKRLFFLDLIFKDFQKNFQKSFIKFFKEFFKKIFHKIFKISKNCFIRK